PRLPQTRRRRRQNPPRQGRRSLHLPRPTPRLDLHRPLHRTRLLRSRRHTHLRATHPPTPGQVPPQPRQRLHPDRNPPRPKHRRTTLLPRPRVLIRANPLSPAKPATTPPWGLWRGSSIYFPLTYSHI